MKNWTMRRCRCRNGVLWLKLKWNSFQKLKLLHFSRRDSGKTPKRLIIIVIVFLRPKMSGWIKLYMKTAWIRLRVVLLFCLAAIGLTLEHSSVTRYTIHLRFNKDIYFGAIALVLHAFVGLLIVCLFCSFRRWCWIVACACETTLILMPFYTSVSSQQFIQWS